MFHNYDPSLRPQEKAVEYVRALNAAKLDKVIQVIDSLFVLVLVFPNVCLW